MKRHMTRFLALGFLTLSSVCLAANPQLFPQPSVLTLLGPDVSLTEPKIEEPPLKRLSARC